MLAFVAVLMPVLSNMKVKVVALTTFQLARF
jgi:hypothetical protein